ncbi:MAG: phosphatase PAP2 family protein [Actinomycetota bacterium]|nr:phosphatase PAP2 family protein [Actinomycetota bacterium]
MPEKTRLGARTIRTLIVVALLAVGVAALALNWPFGTTKQGPLGGQPLPQLFPDSRLSLVDTLVAPAQARAHRDAERWLAAHPGRDDAAFAAFALNSVGDPPTGAAQQRELAELHRVDARRTPAGVTAANWLEAHGKKDVWKLYVKQYGQFAGKPAAKRAKRAFKATYRLAKNLAAQGKARFARPAPYISDPSLHAINQARFAKKFSYPAKHTLISFALAALLTRYEGHRAPEYRWMADEISYSRMYAGGHYPSDIAAGAYLGTLANDYEMHVPVRRSRR